MKDNLTMNCVRIFSSIIKSTSLKIFASLGKGSKTKSQNSLVFCHTPGKNSNLKEEENVCSGTI